MSGPHPPRASWLYSDQGNALKQLLSVTCPLVVLLVYDGVAELFGLRANSISANNIRKI